MIERTTTIDGIRTPRFFYGTAWKEDETQRLTELALRQGFRAIDTANQRRHYYEEAVGNGIAAAIADGVTTRDELFLQTKFTFLPGQDHRLPYNPDSPIREQVQQSFASSQQHLQTESIDSYVLHGPSRRVGLGEDDWEAWRAMEEIHKSGAARLLGVSNVSAEQLRLLCDDAAVRPAFVQNRCFAVTMWDREVREFCRANQIVYQGFSLLTANTQALSRPEIRAIANRYDKTVCQIIFRFALEVGMFPLTGTSNAEHMRQDLDVFDFALEPHEVQQIEWIAVA